MVAQLSTTLVSQAATMRTHGFPNGMFACTDPVAAVLLLPILNNMLYPWLRRRGRAVSFRGRMAAGFFLAGLAMLYAAYTQRKIYTSPPCYAHPRSPDCFDGQVPNDVDVLWQLPTYIFIAAAEVLAAVAAMEYAYDKAPGGMRSLVMAVYLVMTAAGAGMAAAAAPWMGGTGMGWVFGVLAVGPLVAGGVVWGSGIVETGKGVGS